VQLTAPFGDGYVDIQLVKPDSGTPVPSGSMTSEGNALAFSYTVYHSGRSCSSYRTAKFKWNGDGEKEG